MDRLNTASVLVAIGMAIFIGLLVWLCHGMPFPADGGYYR